MVSRTGCSLWMHQLREEREVIVSSCRIQKIIRAFLDAPIWVIRSSSFRSSSWIQDLGREHALTWRVWEWTQLEPFIPPLQSWRRWWRRCKVVGLALFTGDDSAWIRLVFTIFTIFWNDQSRIEGGCEEEREDSWTLAASQSFRSAESSIGCLSQKILCRQLSSVPYYGVNSRLPC